LEKTEESFTNKGTAYAKAQRHFTITRVRKGDGRT
jgi:hypothetical protein